jgi:hypothetical protein
MQLRKGSLLIFFALTIKAQSPPPLPTWQDEIAKNFMPYHQLTTTDFPINDKVHRDTSCWVSPFLHYYYHVLEKSTRGGVVYAYVTHWTIFSGLDKNETSRRSGARNLKEELPYAQALLDLNEIWARQMAALAPGEFPGGRGDNFAAARDDLDARVKTFCRERYKPFEIELEAFVKETKRGENKEKVRELSAAIRKRLDAIPPTPAASAVPAIITAPSPTSAPMPSPCCKMGWR